MNIKIKFIEQTEGSLGELILCGLILCEAYLEISDLRLRAKVTHRTCLMDEVDLEWALIALMVMISKRGPMINDKNHLLKVLHACV